MRDEGREDGGRAATLVARLRDRARRHPDRVAFTFLPDGETPSDRLAYGALTARAEAAARGLRARGAAGGRVLLVHPQGPDFVVAFLAALLAGAAAVPAPSAAPGRANRARLLSIAGDCAPALAVTVPGFLDEARAALGPLPVATLDDLEAEGAGGPPLPDPAPDDLALIQYTSGSTGTPKGVAVPHAAIAANQALIRERFGHSEATVTVGWLPLFHDMGLIGNMLQPLWTGSTCVLMPPAAFLAEPARWLRAIDRFGGTTAGAPNFAYDLCVERTPPEARAALDLSRWSVAYNGSEPVRARTLWRFAQAFAPAGFRPEALFPCYGMAEATLFVAGVDRARAPRLRAEADATRVGCGQTGTGHRLAVVDPATRAPRPAGAEGEIWFTGPSVARGYWNRPAESAALFGARLAGDAATRWLRTGDLGRIEADGELVVTGRIKDVLIVRGRNHHPQDIEATVQAAHPALRPDGAAAVLVEGEPPRLAVVQELRRQALRDPPVEAIGRAVRAAVAREHGLQVAALVLLRPGGLPRTSSGKVRRRAAHDGLLDGTLPEAGRSLMGWAPPAGHPGTGPPPGGAGLPPASPAPEGPAP